MGQGCTLEVFAVFEDEARSERKCFAVKLGNAQSIKGCSPVKSFGYGGLFEYGLVISKTVDSLSHLHAQFIIHVGQLGS